MHAYNYKSYSYKLIAIYYGTYMYLKYEIHAIRLTVQWFMVFVLLSCLECS